MAGNEKWQGIPPHGLSNRPGGPRSPRRVSELPVSSDFSPWDQSTRLEDPAGEILAGGQPQTDINKFPLTPFLDGFDQRLVQVLILMAMALMFGIPRQDE